MDLPGGIRWQYFWIVFIAIVCYGLLVITLDIDPVGSVMHLLGR